MSQAIRLKTPLTDADVEKLKAGDKVLHHRGDLHREGRRPQATLRLIEGRETPSRRPQGADHLLRRAGPGQARPCRSGPPDPTTSGRMDAYSPKLMEIGLKGMIGKGMRKKEVIEAMKKYKAVYFAATGGAGALLAKSVKKAQIVAYEDLGPEAINRLEVVDFPAIVVNDTKGNDLYQQGMAQVRPVKTRLYGTQINADYTDSKRAFSMDPSELIS